MKVPPEPEIELPWDLAVSSRGVCPKDSKSTCNRDPCTTVSVAALFIIAKLWDQPGHLFTHEQIENVRLRYTVEFVHP